MTAMLLSGPLQALGNVRSRRGPTADEIVILHGSAKILPTGHRSTAADSLPGSDRSDSMQSRTLVWKNP